MRGRDWMPLDYNSLLLAIGFSAACLSVTMFGAWMSARTESFLLTWAVGALFIVGNVFAYDAYVAHPGRLLGLFAFTLLLVGFATLLGAARQFRTGAKPLRAIALTAAAALAVTLPPMAAGYDGLSFIIYNLVAGAILAATGVEHWKGRAEAPTPITGISVLYVATSISFVLCALVLIADGRMVLGSAPDNWAEDLSLVVAIAGMSGIGALSLALNQWRLARRHRQEARTDGLTGLLNRRALFDEHGKRRFSGFESVVVFDLDHFKGINDRFGHSVGDRVLRRFADILSANLRSTDMAARLGGEEFVAVLMRTLPDKTSAFAERVRELVAAEELTTDQGPLRWTVSAGVAFGRAEGANFEALLRQADDALYLAKNAGRNKVVTPSVKLVG